MCPRTIRNLSLPVVVRKIVSASPVRIYSLLFFFFPILSRDVSTPRVSLRRVTSGRPCPFVTLHFARDSIAINSVFNQLIIPLVCPPQHRFLVCLCEIRCISSSHPFLSLSSHSDPLTAFSRSSSACVSLFLSHPFSRSHPHDANTL